MIAEIDTDSSGTVDFDGEYLTNFFTISYVKALRSKYRPHKNKFQVKSTREMFINYE